MDTALDQVTDGILHEAGPTRGKHQVCLRCGCVIFYDDRVRARPFYTPGDTVAASWVPAEPGEKVSKAGWAFWKSGLDASFSRSWPRCTEKSA